VWRLASYSVDIITGMCYRATTKYFQQPVSVITRDLPLNKPRVVTATGKDRSVSGRHLQPTLAGSNVVNSLCK
uniref:Uncharacterized protein n=1 Tax=Monopterus albus TaxID=43700 RepID=A0A3Q3IBD7_MONAL